MSRKKIERNIAYDEERGKYYVTLNYGIKNGKQIKKTETFKKKRDAQNRLREFEGEKVKDDIIMPINYTLSQWLDYWLEEVVMTHCAKTTYAGYKYIIDNHLKPHLGSIQLQDLDGITLQKYFREKQKEDNSKGERKISDNTLRKHHVLLLTSLKKAEKIK